MTENSFPRVTLRLCALMIRPWIHLIQTPKTAKYADDFFPFNCWSAYMSAKQMFPPPTAAISAPCFAHSCMFSVYNRSRSGAIYFLPHIYCSDWQRALNSVGPSLCTTKELSAFVFKSSERQAPRSRPSEDNLQWAGANLLSAYSEERGGRREKKKQKNKPNALAKKKNSFIYWLITTLFRNYTGKLLQKVTFHGCRRRRRIVFLINYPLITDRLIRDKYQRRPIPLGHVQYAPRAAIFVDLFGSKLASPLLLPLPESPGCAR